MTLDHRGWAEYLLAAMDERREVVGIAKQVDSLTVDDGYAIQRELMALRLARGERLVGAKLGLTSVAKQQQMGVSEPCYGWVFDSSVLNDDDVALHELIHPRAEPEFVFRIGTDLSGADVTAADVLDATAEVTGGIEVIDSRYEAFSFTLPDVVADNTSAARVRLGDSGLVPVLPPDRNLASVKCALEVDGEVAATASGAALLGDPAECVAMLVRHLHRRGQGVKAGWVVLAGAATDAKPLAAGITATARYSRFGAVTVKGV
jgi:2-oxo-3-hexenedioate decarboxylase